MQSVPEISEIDINPLTVYATAGIVAIGLVDLRLQYRPHVPRFDTDHRQLCFGQCAKQPL